MAESYATEARSLRILEAKWKDWAQRETVIRYVGTYEWIETYAHKP
jgi:hypothetical protein